MRLFPVSYPSVSLSVGYNETLVIDRLSSAMTFGFMLDLKPISVQYAFTTTDVYQSSQQHFVSVGTRWSQ